MNCTIRSASGAKASQLAAEALKHRLYVSGWRLSCDLKEISQYPLPEHTIALAYKMGVPVSVAVYMGYRFLEIGVFTRAAERRNGYGRAVVRALQKRTGRKFMGHLYGIEGAELFFRACGLRIRG